MFEVANVLFLFQLVTTTEKDFARKQIDKRFFANVIKHKNRIVPQTAAAATKLQ